MAKSKYDKLKVKVGKTRSEMGELAARDFTAKVIELLGEKETLNIVFAAAPSQNDVLESLCKKSLIPWHRIHAYHMDEYAGFTREKEQSFGHFLDEHIFGKVPFASVSYIGTGLGDAEECERYSALLKKNPPDIVLMGIGENGHIAFNDPPVADFNDKSVIKRVTLDEVCRMQQVHDKCFPTLDDVPKYALTLTVPTLMSAKALFCVVPGKQKAAAVQKTAEGAIGEHCPASALRTHPCATLYLEKESASLLK